MKKMFAVILVICMMMTAVAGMAEEAQNLSVADAQKLDATYTLALNAINQEDYAKARKYLNIAFV